MNEKLLQNERLSENSWDAVLKGDHDIFNRITEPYLEEMSQVAERELLYHQYLGHFGQDDVNVEELVAEALLWAWRTRRNRPEGISMKVWLLGTLHRVVERKVKQEALLRNMESVSLESPVPSKAHFDDDQSYWDWHQPDDFTKWEDIIEDHEVSPYEHVEFEERETYNLPKRSRQVFLYHDKDRLAPQEVAYILSLTVKETLDILGSARKEIVKPRETTNFTADKTDSVLEHPGSLKKIDSSGMLDILSAFPEQIESAIGLAEQLSIDTLNVSSSELNAVVVTGMGGSAIGGDILAGWLADLFAVPIFVNRNYSLPGFVNKNTLLFAVSYSGNTEETLGALSEGLERGCKCIGISSGGRLRNLCIEKGCPYLQIPEGFPPRAAFAYLFFPMAVLLKRMKMIEEKGFEAEIKDVLATLRDARSELAPETDMRQNIAKQQAEDLKGSTPVIYGIPHFAAIARRWQTQLNENSKVLARYDEFPEMNHNDLVGWAEDDLTTTKGWSAIFLRDEDEHPRISKRIEFTKSILSSKSKKVIEVWLHGQTFLAKMIYFVYVGDFVSTYLAILRGVDPTPVKTIEELKEWLTGEHGSRK